MTPFHILIPARLNATRLPRKPLLPIGDKPMIQHIVERAQQSGARSITVATDHAEVQAAVQAFANHTDTTTTQAILTSPDHPCGSDRIAEAIDLLNLPDDTLIVNVQGDEPQIPPRLITQVADLLAQKQPDTPAIKIATATAPLADPAHLTDPSIVKVVTDHADNALYFSRAAIPHQRDGDESDTPQKPRRHLGIYAYRAAYLREFAKRPPCPLEQHEKLEQLRALWYGDKIACAQAIEIPPPGIDTPADLARVRAQYQSQ